mmetsp:Transcript_36859/g.41067  ORF Transcript_36859/g.41067 Transcript_36859/m.41067 type:complete len:230 (-) Transcript_36859:435-1124(-)
MLNAILIIDDNEAMIEIDTNEDAVIRLLPNKEEALELSSSSPPPFPFPSTSSAVDITVPVVLVRQVKKLSAAYDSLCRTIFCASRVLHSVAKSTPASSVSVVSVVDDDVSVSGVVVVTTTGGGDAPSSSPAAQVIPGHVKTGSIRLYTGNNRSLVTASTTPATKEEQAGQHPVAVVQVSVNKGSKSRQVVALLAISSMSVLPPCRALVNEVRQVSSVSPPVQTPGSRMH